MEGPVTGPDPRDDPKLVAFVELLTGCERVAVLDALVLDPLSGLLAHKVQSALTRAMERRGFTWFLASGGAAVGGYVSSFRMGPPPRKGVAWGPTPVAALGRAAARALRSPRCAHDELHELAGGVLVTPQERQRGGVCGHGNA